MESKRQGRTIRVTAALALVGLVCISVTGCRPAEKADGSNTDYCTTEPDSRSQKPSVEVAAVLAPTTNFVDFDTIVTAAEARVKDQLGFQLSDSEIENAVGNQLSVVIADGVPKLATLRTVDPEGRDVSDIEKEIETTFQAFGDVASCAAGDLKRKYDQIETNPESDLLAGLSIAVDQFAAGASSKTIYVLGNGYQTSGAIQMQKDGKFPKSEAYADQLVNGLSNIGALPDLKGATVIWYGLGQTDGTELSLDEKSRNSLIYFWQQVIAKSNGELLDSNIFSQVGSGKPNKNAIKVTSGEVKPCPLLITLYESDGVEFKANSDSFVNQTKARQAASKVVSEFNKEGCEEMTVHGYAAAGVDRKNYDENKSEIDAVNSSLTLSRAKAFKALLRAAGFKGQINTEGKGTCGSEWKENGNVDSNAQKLCRRVEVSN